MTTNRARWRGLCALIGDAVGHGSTAVERIHMATARRPFQIIEKIPPLAAPAKVVHGIHDAIVTSTYDQIRWWNGTVQTVLQAALKDSPERAEGAAPQQVTPEKPEIADKG